MPMRTHRDKHRALAEAHRREAAELVRLAAHPFEMGERINSLIGKAARKLGFPYSRTEDLWRMEARRIDSWEMDLLREMRTADAGRQKRGPRVAPRARKRR